MKLPGIDYGGRGQRLATVSPSLPVQTANAWAGAANAWGRAIDALGDQLDEVGVEEAYLNGRRALDEAEFSMRRGVWNAAEQGQPPADVRIRTRDRLGDQATYQTHEFAGGYYDHVTQQVLESSTQGLSANGARKARAKLMAYATQRRSKVREDQYNRGRSYARGALLNTTNTLVREAQWNNRYEVIDQINENLSAGVNMGYWDLEEAEKLRVQYLDEAMYSAATSMIMSVEDSTADLDNAEVLLQREPYGFKATQRKELMTVLERQRNRVERKLQAEDEDRRERNDIELRRRLYQGGNVNSLIDQSQAIGSASGTVRLMDLAYTRDDRSARYSDPEAKAQIAEMMTIAPNSSDPFHAYDSIERMLLADQTGPNPKLAPEDAREYQRQLFEMREAPMKTQAYRQTVAAMRQEITNSTEQFGGIFGGTEILRFNDAQSDLNAYLRTGGPDADPQKWWQDNRTFYEESLWKDRRISQSGVPKRYVDSDKENTVDFEASQTNLDEALNAGELDDEQHRQHSLNLKRLQRLLGDE